MKPSINKKLYEKRLALNLSLKEASNFLKISKLHLNLIEKGYLYVPKKKRQNFIDAYNLPSNFFVTHSNWAEPLSVTPPMSNAITKLKKIAGKTSVKIISLIVILSSITTITLGIYNVNKRVFNPRAGWTEKFANFIEGIRKDPEATKSIDPISLDVIYSLSFNIHISDNEFFYGKASTYGKDRNVFASTIDLTHAYVNEDGYVSQINQSFFGTQNKNATAFSYDEGTAGGLFIPTSIYYFNEKGFDLPPFAYSINDQNFVADVGSDVYKIAYGLIEKNLPIYETIIEEKFLAKHNYEFFEFFRDANKAFAKIYYDFSVGYLMSILGMVFLIMFLFVLILSFYESHKAKKQNEKRVEKENKIEKISYNISFPTRSVSNDIAFCPFLPESILRIIGIVIVSLFSISFFIMANKALNGNIAGSINVKHLRDISSQFLITGTTLLFFVKIDVFYRKPIGQILQSIIFLFIGGLIYYFFEVMTCAFVGTREGLVNIIVSIFYNYIPGNIVWNIMLYYVIFLFLFTTPKKLENRPHLILLYRLCSLIPVLVIIGVYIYKGVLNDISAPYYIMFLFYTKSIPTVLFSVLYLFGLYFLRLYLSLQMGVEKAERFYDTRRYALIKNIMASILLLIIICVDLPFYFLSTNNRLGLGTSWPLALLIPLIMCYRPHIGARNFKIDSLYTWLYGLCFASGYVATFILISSKIGIEFFIYLLM